MKRLILFFVVASATLTSVAQQFVIINGEAIKADDIESMTYQQDETFQLLPDKLAEDEKTQLFSKALQLTGLADSLKTYYDYDYDKTYADIHQYHNYVDVYGTGSPIQWLSRRYVKFTAFIETDDVLTAHGITSIEGLKAYAKKVYDEVYPEDASITDPTDRRHSLNRFVSYHLLPFGATRETLTAYPNYLRQDISDVADWYVTMMPHASLKVSRPRTGNVPETEIGLFLNRRGLQNGPDKYGVQTRGVEIGEAVETANGSYFYIDDLLTYDKKTQTETLQERWRIDFVTLSPDFMTAGTRSNIDLTRDNSLPGIGFDSKFTEGIEWGDWQYLYFAPVRFHYWCYGGDELSIQSDNGVNDISIDLPSLPEGDYELRFGSCLLSGGPIVEISLNDDLLRDTVDLGNTNALTSFGWSNPSSYTEEETRLLLEYRTAINSILNSLDTKLSYPSWLRYDERTGWQIKIDNSNYYRAMTEEEQALLLPLVCSNYIPADYESMVNLITQYILVDVDEDHIVNQLTGTRYESRETDSGYRLYIQGSDEEVQYSSLRDMWISVFKRAAFRLNGWMPAPREAVMSSSNDIGYWQYGNTAMSDVSNLSRRIVGRFHVDGSTNLNLRIKSLYFQGSSRITLDYVEFCPVSVADHPTIAEDE